jgi:hypothetical protein
LSKISLPEGIAMAYLIVEFRLRLRNKKLTLFKTFKTKKHSLWRIYSIVSALLSGGQLQ